MPEPRSIRSFLRSQWLVLLCAVLSTVLTILLAAHFLGAGVSGWLGAHPDLLRETSRGQPNPGGGTALGLVMVPLFAAAWWWSFLSEWRDFRKQPPAPPDGMGEGKKPPQPPGGKPRS